MTPSRAAIVATAGESIARGSRSFAAASRLFDRATRERAWLLYGWCRKCDDLADGQDHGHGMQAVADPAARLASIRAMTATALEGAAIQRTRAGEPLPPERWVGDPAFDALRIVVAETGMPERLVWDLIEGFALDAAGWRPQDEADLLRYCYHVAGAVGCMMAVVMGVAPDDAPVLDRACDLGLAFQLANIARDLAEDEAAGRCYLPASWLAETADRAVHAARLAAMAADYEASARGGTPALGLRSAWAVLAAADIYGGIVRKVAARGAHAWDARVTTSGSEKLAAILAAWPRALQRSRLYRAVPRPAELWTRPR